MRILVLFVLVLAVCSSAWTQQRKPSSAQDTVIAVKVLQERLEKAIADRQGYIKQAQDAIARWEKEIIYFNGRRDVWISYPDSLWRGKKEDLPELR